jgi:hypothetical protein
MSAPLLEQLAKKIRTMETANRSFRGKNAISTGCPELDAQLPQGGYEPGTIVEWLEPRKGSGGWYLALAAARQAVTASDSQARYWVVVDRQKYFYPPAARSMGLPLDRLIVLHPLNAADEAWAVDQALRCPAVGAVIAELDDVSELQARRFQLAAEQGRSLGLFLRPLHVRRQPSWAEVQWLIEPTEKGTQLILNETCKKNELSLPFRRLTIQALRMRSGLSSRRWHLKIDLRLGTIGLEDSDAVSSSVCLASQLAMPTTVGRGSRRHGSAAVRAASA